MLNELGEEEKGAAKPGVSSDILAYKKIYPMVVESKDPDIRNLGSEISKILKQEQNVLSEKERIRITNITYAGIVTNAEASMRDYKKFKGAEKYIVTEVDSTGKEEKKYLYIKDNKALAYLKPI